MGSWTHKPEKRAASKAVRQQAKRMLPERLDDDYTTEEFFADICRDDDPCPWCLRRRESSESAPTGDA
jgi:hypothetical protein